MKTEITQHTDGTWLIDLTAETDADRIANKLLLQRYNNLRVVGEESFIGSWNSDGSELTLKVFQFPPEELAARAEADAMIAAFNRTSEELRRSGFSQLPASKAS